MNCRSCLNKSDAYRSKRLSDEALAQVETHLETCKECKESFRLDAVVDIVIDHEKEMLPNPFLTTRIMSKIETIDGLFAEKSWLFNHILRPAIILSSLAAAIFLGILLGNIYPVNREPLPLEISLIDDLIIESVDFLSID